MGRRRTTTKRKRKSKRGHGGKQKGAGIDQGITKFRLGAIPKGAKMLYKIAKGKPVSDRIKRKEDEYKRRYAAYRKAGGTMTKLQWSEANNAVIKPEACSIM